MSTNKNFEDRFIIDCYGIIDTHRRLTGKCEDDRLSWCELCETLNNLYNSADLDKEELLLQNRNLELENDRLKWIINSIRRKTDEL